MGKRWSVKEDDILKALNIEGKNYKEISEALKTRTHISCQQRGRTLGQTKQEK